MINGLYLGAMHEISTYRSVQIGSDPLVSVTRGGGWGAGNGGGGGGGPSAYDRGGEARR